MKKRYFLTFDNPYKNHNPYKESFDNFDQMKSSVELLMLKKEGCNRFSLSHILFDLRAKISSLTPPPVYF